MKVMNTSPFEEIIVLDFIFEFFLGYKDIVHTTLKNVG